MQTILAEINFLENPGHRSVYGIPGNHRACEGDQIPVADSDLPLSMGDVVWGDICEENSQRIFLIKEQLTINQAIEKLVECSNLPVYAFDKPFELLMKVLRRDLDDMLQISRQIKHLKEKAMQNFIDTEGAKTILDYTEHKLAEIQISFLKERYTTYKQDSSQEQLLKPILEFYIHELHHLGLYITQEQLVGCINGSESFETFGKSLDNLVESLVDKKSKYMSLKSMNLERFKHSRWSYLVPFVRKARRGEIRRTIIKQTPKGCELPPPHGEGFGDPRSSLVHQT